LNVSSSQHSDANTSRPPSSKPATQNNHLEERTVTIINDSNRTDRQEIKVNIYRDKISDLKEKILKLWPLNNYTVDQLELYVYDSVLNRKLSLNDKPKDTLLIMIYDSKYPKVSFVVKSDLPNKSKEELKIEINKNPEKPQITATRSVSDHGPKNSTGPLSTASYLDDIPNGLCSLENIGNTCYMNSALQCLSNIPLLTHFFINNRIIDLINSKNPAGSGGLITLTYSSLIQEMWSGKIEKCIPTALKERIDSYTDQFNDNNQHDSQEFMTLLLDVLHEDLLSIQSDRSPISELFYGQIETTFLCENKCPAVVVSSKFNFLPLPIPMGKTKVDLSQCMQLFLEKDYIGNHGKWNCDSCHKKTNASKLTKIKKLPPVLILQLKRFDTFVVSNKQYPTSRKNQTLVEYPIDKLISSILVPDFAPTFVYELVAISIHHGRSLNSGHFTTIAKNRKNNLWYNFDDSLITSANEKDIQTKDAYILCYVRSDVTQVHLKSFH
jgi:ubiquitin carboxyl-terminal hydrolase 8